LIPRAGRAASGETAQQRLKFRPNPFDRQTMKLAPCCRAKSMTCLKYHHMLCHKYHMMAISRQLQKYFLRCFALPPLMLYGRPRRARLRAGDFCQQARGERMTGFFAVCDKSPARSGRASLKGVKFLTSGIAAGLMCLLAPPAFAQQDSGVR